MSDKIKLNYPAMREMSDQCKNTAQRLQETVSLGQKLAQELQNGALVGDSGEAFANALLSSFVPAVNRLSQKFNEVSRDIQAAIADMQAQDKGAGGLFGG